MASRAAPKTPSDNESLSGLFDPDCYPTEGAAQGGQQGIFNTAAYIVKRSGVKDLLQTWVAEDLNGRRPGPKPSITREHVITLMPVLTLSRRPPLFTEMRDLLRHTPRDMLKAIGIELPDGLTDVALYHRAYHSYRRLVLLMDPEPRSTYRKLSKDELAERQQARQADVCAQRRERASDFFNAMMHGTWMLLSRDARRAYKGNVAVDATIIKAPARGTSGRSPFASADPEAGWYKRDGDHDGTQKTSRAATAYTRTTSSLIWGRELHTVVPYGDEVPVITLAGSLDVPGKRLAVNALTGIDALRQRGLPTGHFVSDRAYLPGTKPADLALPLRARGYSLVFDYEGTSRSLGVQASHGGAILVDGQWYYPSMPEPLRNASIDYFVRQKDDSARTTEPTYRERLKQREQYALPAKQRPDTEGHQRLQCPAVGPSATLRCERKPSHPTAQDRPLTRVLPLMLVNPSPRVCEQNTMTFPPSVGAKYEQTYPYRSEVWQQHFTTGRQCVESMNKSMKDGRFVPVDDAELRPRRGWIAQLFSLAVMIAATNTRKIIAWAHQRQGVTPLASRPSRRTRRRDLTKGWSIAPNAPPAAAETA